MTVVGIAPSGMLGLRGSRNGNLDCGRCSKLDIKFASLPLVAVLTLVSSATASDITGELLARSKRVALNPVHSEIVDFGRFLIAQESTLTRQERERGDLTLAAALGSYSPDEIILILGELKGVRSASLTELAMSFAEKEIHAAEAREFIKSTPEGVVDCFLESIDSTRYRGHFLLELDDAALAALLAELDQATSSERKVKIIGMISWVITERRASLSPDVVQRAIKEARDHLPTIGNENRKRAEGYLETLGTDR